jgi:MFS family permease
MKDKRLLIIFITVFIDLVGFGIIIPMNPYLARVFAASPFQVGLLMSVYSLMQFVFSPMWGQISDRIGRRPVILLSLFGASAAHLGFAFSTGFWALVVARSLAGLFGGNLSTAMAYIADITPERDRSKGMGLIGAAFGLGFVLGPLIGYAFGTVGEKLGSAPPLGQSFPAVIASLICFLNFLFAWRALPESLQPGAAVQARATRLARILAALTTPLLGGLVLLNFLNTFALAHVEATLFMYVQDQFHWSQSWASLGFAYIGVIMVITQGYIIRKLMPKYGERNLLLCGLLFSAAGYGLCAGAAGLSWLALGVTGLALGTGLTNPSLNGSISLVSGKDVQGNNLGVSQSLASLARILGPPTGGLLYQRLGPWSPFAGAAAVCLVGLGLAAGLRGRLPQMGKAH